MKLLAGDLLTGLIQVRNIPALDGSVIVTLNGAGTINATIQLPLTDPQTGQDIPLAKILKPGKSFLAFEDGGVIINAGPIWSDKYDFDTQKLELRAAGLRSYFNYRFILPALNDALSTDVPVGHDTIYTAATSNATSLNTIAKRLIVQARTWTNGSVPIVFESDIAGANERTFYGKELKTIGAELNNITNVLNGPDIDFRPRYKPSDNNYVEWQMLTGLPQLKQAGADLVWDTTVPNPAVKSATMTRDGSVLVTDNYQVGSVASGASVPTMAKSYNNTLTTAGYARLESVVSRGSNGDPNLLQGYATDATATGKYHMETWAFQANRIAAPLFGTYNAGDFAKIKIKNNPRVDDGIYRMRIIQYSAKLADQFVVISCAPERL